MRCLSLLSSLALFVLGAAACSPPSDSEQDPSGGDGGSGLAGEGGAGAGTAAGGAGSGAGTAQGGSGAGTSQGGSGAGTAQGGNGGSTGTGGGAPGEKRLVGYFTAWSVYGRDYHVPEIPAGKLTHINYAFANISDSGECVMGDPYADADKFYPGDSWDPGAKRGSFHQLELLKAAHPKLRTLISVGGWSWSGKFSDVALTPESRSKLVTSCVTFMKEHGFDGIDVDWEYPVGGGLPTNTYRPEDEQNYTLLLQAFRDALDVEQAASQKTYDLTIAAPAGPGIYANIELQKVGQILSWINLMAYDFHGGWDEATNFNAALFPASGDPSADPAVKTKFNVGAAVDGYLASGVPANKLVLGVPFYGRGYAGVTNEEDGLFQPFSGLPMGTWEAGVFDYHDLVAKYVPTMTRHWHEQSQVPWLFDPATGIMISYDDPESLQKKAELVLQKNLGGAMLWELSGDTTEATLLSALHTSLGN